MWVDDFFSWEALATFAGAVGFVWLAANALRRQFGVDPRYSAALLALFVQAAVWAAQGGDERALVLALFNAFPVYFAATGLNEAVAKQPDEVHIMAREVGHRSRFFIEKWWR